MILRRIMTLVVAMTLAVCTTGWTADEAATANKPAQAKVKGLDLATDVVGDVVTKAGALLGGNLEVTMEVSKDKSLTKNDYTYNALGQRVPKTTATKTGGALHN